MRFSKRKLHFCGFSFLCWRNRNRKKKKENGKGQRNPIKIVFFEVVIQKCEKSKNGFFAKIAWHYLCQEGRKNTHFRAHYLFWPKNVWPKTVQTRKNYKNSGFSGNCPKPKMTPFLQKGVFFDMGEKVGFTNCVFEKLCFFSENTIFIVFSEKHSSCNTNTVCKQKTENWWKIVGFSWTWQRSDFYCLFLFSGFNVIVFFCLVKLQEW